MSTESRSPVYEAQQAGRYDRQELIRKYEEKADCRLVVMIGPIIPQSVTLFEELIYDANPEQDLKLLLDSPGGDGEVAIRIVRAAQSRCKELTVIIPDQAKSAATLLSLGAHSILMGPAGDLGPIDPQLHIKDDLVSAKDIISAVESASEQVMAYPATYPIHASLLSDMDAIMVQKARSALARTDQQLDEALRSNPDRTEVQVKTLIDKLEAAMIQENPTHGALFSADDAREAGLPVIKVDTSNELWKIIWQLWTRYFVIGAKGGKLIYENSKVSQVHSLNED